eukprot:4762661-Karenia_brevis.AAC.1
MKDTLLKRLTAARGAFAKLHGLLVAGAIPLPLALPLFESKVDGPLEFARGLYGVSGSACKEFNAFQEKC